MVIILNIFKQGEGHVMYICVFCLNIIIQVNAHENIRE